MDLIRKGITLLDRLGILDKLSDETCINLLYRREFGVLPDLEDPKTFNEKIQWLKLHDRNLDYALLVDKYEVKKIVAEKIGKQYIVPTLGVWDSFDDINFSLLPNQFVLKCTHDSGGIVICKDKKNFNYESAKKIMDKALKQKFYRRFREWVYENVKPRIIAEMYMEDTESKDLKDYKFFCFNGKVKCFKIDFDRYTEHHANYYDINNQLLRFGEDYCPPVLDREIKLPVNLELMKKLSEELSKGIRFLRVDFYEVDGHVYFGELTFYPLAGLGKFTDPKADELLGDWLKL